MKKNITLLLLATSTLIVYASNQLSYQIEGTITGSPTQFGITTTDWALSGMKVGSIPQGKFNTTFNFTAEDPLLAQFPIAISVQSSGNWLGLEYIRIISPNATNMILLDNQVYTLNQLYYADYNKTKSYQHTFLFEVAPKEIGYINGTLTFTATYRSGT